MVIAYRIVSPEKDSWVRAGEQTPCFNLVDNRGTVGAFGWTRLFKLPTQGTTTDANRSGREEAHAWDLAQGIFGRLANSGEDIAGARARVFLKTDGRR